MGALKMLVVDDEPGLRTTLAANLELEGYDVVEARSGEEALKLAQAEHFDLVLSDIRMDGMNGVELFHKLRERSLQMPVVLMTGFAMEELVQSAVDDGAFTVLPKPFNVEHALAVVSSAARKPMVLVIDDAHAVATSLASALGSCGLDARAMTSGQEAVAALGEGVVDLCVVDLVMPEQNGAEVVKALKAQNPRVRFIGMSGHDAPEIIRKMAAQGVDTFLRKPFMPHELVRAIATARGSNNVE